MLQVSGMELLGMVITFIAVQVDQWVGVIGSA